MTSSSLCIRPSTKFHLDIDELIREVHYRPAIWNKNCIGYTDRRLKARMWDEVCENIINNWKKLKIIQQNTISTEIQKKWRNVKDAFNKEMKKISTGQDTGKKRQYCHFKALSFLSNAELYHSKSAVSLDGSDDESDNTSIDQETTNVRTSRKRSRNKNEDEDESLILVKREKLPFDEENSNSEHSKRNTDKHDDNLFEIDLEKSDYAEENEFPNKKAQNRSDYSDRHFIEIKCDDWENETTCPIVGKMDQDKHFVKNNGVDKVYDEDVSFAEMLVPMMRKLNDDQKHFAKIEILHILHKAKRYLPSSTCETQTEDTSGCNGRNEGS